MRGICNEEIQSMDCSTQTIVNTARNLNIGILLPVLPPIGSCLRFNTIKNLTLVLPGKSYTPETWKAAFFEKLRTLNFMLSQWLNKPTLHFRSPLPREYEVSHLLRSYKRLLWIMQDDPVGQAKAKNVAK
jgi:hypothetical protein